MAVRGRTLKVTLLGDASGLNRMAQDAKRQLGGLQKSLETHGRSLQRGGMALTAGLTAPIVGAATVAVRSASSFEAAMTESLAIMGDVSAGMRAEMEATARTVGRETTFSAKEAAESYFFLASAGLDVEQQIAAMPAVAAFAQAGMFDMARATDLATDAQSALGLVSADAQENLDNLTRVTDVFVGANTLANASVEQFSEAITNKAGAALRSVNKDLEEGAAVLALYADRGVKGRAAGEGLSILLRDISRAAVANTGDWAELGIEVFDSAGNLKNLADVLDEVDGAMAGMSDAQKAAAFDALGLTRGVADQIRILSGGADQIREYEGELRNMSGITKDVRDKQLKSLNAQWQLFKGELEDVAITLGQALIPALKDVLEAIKPLVGWVAEMAQKFADADPKTQKIVIVLAALAAALGPLLIMLGTFMIGLAALIPILGLLLSPFALIVIAIAAVVAAGVLLWQNWDTVKEKASQLASWIWETFQRILGFVTGLVEGIAERFAPLLTMLGPAGVLLSVWAFRDDIVAAFEWVKDHVGGAISWVIERIEALIGIIDRAVQKLPELKQAAADLPGAGAVGAATSGGGRAGDVARGAGGALLDAVVPGSALRRLPGMLGFDTGGVVPGPLGAPRLAMVHGGETILPTHRGGGFGGVTVNLTVEGHLVAEAELEDRIVQAVERARFRGERG